MNRTVVVVTTAVLLYLAHFAGAAQPEPVRPGDQVRTTQSAPLMAGSDTRMVVSSGSVLTVENVEGDWVGVTATERGAPISGWIERRLLVRVPGPMTAPQASAMAAVRVDTQETSLGKAPEGIVWSSCTANADGTSVAFAVRRGGQWWIALNDAEGPKYDEIAVGQPVFSPDGKRLAYTARRGDRWRVIVDGRESSAFETVGDGSPKFSPDSSHVAYVGFRNGRRPWSLMVKKPGTTMLWPRRFDSARTASDWRTRPNATASGSWWSTGPKTSHATRCEPTILCSAPTEPAWRMPLVAGSQWDLVVDGSVGRVTRGRDIRCSPGMESEICYEAERAGKRLLIVDGAEWRTHDAIGDFVFSPNGSRTAYWAKDGEHWRVVVDGTELAPYDGFGPESLVFSPDGRRLAYVAVRGDRGRVVVDGREDPLYEAILESTPVFSPDGGRLAYGALRDGKWRLVVDGSERGSYDLIGEETVRFVADGGAIACLAGFGNRVTVVVAGRFGNDYNLFARGGAWRLGGEEVFRTVAVRDGELFRVDLRVISSPPSNASRSSDRTPMR